MYLRFHEIYEVYDKNIGIENVFFQIFRNLFSLDIQMVGFLEFFVNYLTKAITHCHGQQVVLIVNFV